MRAPRHSRGGPASRPGWGRLVVANHRGAPVPQTLGFVLLLGAIVSSVVVAADGDVGAPGWGALAAVSLVFAAGLVDDLVAGRARGLRNHLRELVAGRMTTGLLKLVSIVGAAIIVVALGPARTGLDRGATVVLVAASANLWNGLDVRPGRALKAFVPLGLAFVVFGRIADAPAIAGVLAVDILVLPFDLRERAMLGDGGANLLGFAAGVGLAHLLSGGWVLLAAGVAVTLNVVAETVSLSKLIAAFPPMRWLDEAGRLP